MNKTMIFTVQMPESGKPIVYAQMASNIYKNDQKHAEKLIRDWFKANDDMPEDSDITDLAYDMRKDGYAWWCESICFELSKVYG